MIRYALKAVGWSAGAIVVVGLLLVLGVYGFSARDFNRTYALDVAPLGVTVTESSVDVGAHIARVRGCVDCHGEDGSGREFINDPALGVLWASNLTSGEGGIAGYAEADWDRAVRHGVNRKGKPLIFMPSQEFWSLSDKDLAALIAYYRSLPSVDAVRPGPRVGPLGRALHLAGQLPLVPAGLVDHRAERPEAPPAGASAEYGAYLATGCTGCHGSGFSGGRIPGGDSRLAAGEQPDARSEHGDRRLEPGRSVDGAPRGCPAERLDARPGDADRGHAPPDGHGDRGAVRVSDEPGSGPVR